MAMSGLVAISVVGDKELYNKLLQLEPKTANKFLRGAMRAAAKTILPIARAIAPRRTGRLAKALKVRALKRSRRGFGVRVGTKEGDFKGDEFYAAFLEFGHKVGARPGRGTRGDHRRKVAGRHFMAAAARRGRNAANEVFMATLRESLREAWQR